MGVDGETGGNYEFINPIKIELYIFDGRFYWYSDSISVYFMHW